MLRKKKKDADFAILFLEAEAGTVGIPSQNGRHETFCLNSLRPHCAHVREAWLWKNSKAIGAVRIGLAEAKAGEFVVAPDIAADAVEFGVED